MATGDVTVPQNGGQGSIKLHPHVLAVLRWCISCVWSTVSELLQKLMAAPHRPSIEAAKSARIETPNKKRKSKAPQRQRSTEHISPVPKVECVVLHTPEEDHNLDIIFVHGLYGSLANTWRQGDWKQKYKWGPNRVPIKRPTSIPETCEKCDHGLKAPDIQINVKNYDFCLCDYHKRNECEKKLPDVKVLHNKDCCLEPEADNNKRKYAKVMNNSKEDSDISKRQCCSKAMNDPKEKNAGNCYFERDEAFEVEQAKEFLTETVYNKDFMEAVNIIDNYEVQANFVRELFVQDCDKVCGLKQNCNCVGLGEDVRDCPVGCGCVCEKCYSSCWPKDWLQVDYPDARIISVNYTSDPYLWRPIWIKESKRLRLHERADQMTNLLLELGVGQKPIIWVGHSKGGLFIKQIYAEAYEAHLRTQNAFIHNLDSFMMETSEAAKDENTRRASLWYNSAGFMFYSVPHRGSSLADIVLAPLMMRSIELLEISKDCSLVLDLQDRWLKATSTSKPVVRSLVETCRTLMAVLWLKIVTVESADAGVGALCGVSVDHREICKPSSRSCLLYTELLNLIHATLDRCH